MELRWVDTHAHLDRYPAGQREAVLQRARASGVAVVGVGVDVASSQALLGIDGLAGVVVGVHPLRAAEEDAVALRELATAPGVVGIGECGFDARGPGPEDQLAAFARQCELARDLRLPLVLHVDGPGAWELFLEHAEALRGLTVVRHYFTGGAGQAHWHAARGHVLSFGKPLLRGAVLREISRAYPPDRIVIETDSYPLPGRTTEPRDAPAIGAFIGRLRGWDLDEARRRLWENSLRAFPQLLS
jgi:TatD DNase family protein